MKKAKAVIGSAYGDEGKGVFTDYLSSKSSESLVIRFNGGAQAGHTVVTPDGKRHVFGHFGANSFLPNSKTFLSKHFVVNPLLFEKERNILKALNVSPEMFIHINSAITTPFEMILNQWQEDSRGNGRHGSCGVGFGETIQREESNIVSFQMKDILENQSKDKLLQIRNYFVERANQLGFKDNISQNNFILDEGFLEKFVDDCQEMNNHVKACNETLSSSNNIVFEGAQGLLLDQEFGFFPHVTRSNTGLKNIIQICEEYNISELEVVYATRCYTTRHGSGPLKNELGNKAYEGIVDATNIPNTYQGNLRFAYLDLGVMQDTINKDLSSVDLNDIRLKKSIGISCLDQTNQVKFYHHDKLIELPTKEFVKYVSNIFSLPIIESWKGDRNHIKEVL
jgi:adenylosuccinate synthase